MAWKFVLIAVSKKVTFFENFKTNNSHNNEQRDNWSFLYIFFFLSWITETGFAICKTDLLIMWGRKEEKKNQTSRFHCGDYLFWELNLRLNAISVLASMEEKYLQTSVFWDSLLPERPVRAGDG